MNKLTLSLVVVAACTSSSTPSGVPLIKGFKPPAPTAGYKRYVLPDIPDLQPGADINYCQWVEMPTDVDRQVIDMQRYMTTGGHHLTLYASTAIENIGTTRPCTTDDMLSVTFLGGGEQGGASTVNLPGGFAFDFPQKQALMVNTHYLNATDNVLDVQAVVDVKYGDPNNPLRAVGFVAVNWDGFDIPPAQDVTTDAYCTATKQLSFFMWSNHMHQYGKAETSEIIHADQTKTMMAQSPMWSAEQAFNPQWVQWDPSTPFVVNPGDVFHLNCAWHNSTNDDVMFPTEMCVGTGFTLEAMPQAVCEATATPGG